MKKLALALALALALTGSVFGQIIPMGYNYTSGEIINGERQFTDDLGATFGYTSDESVSRVLLYQIEEVYDEAKKVMTSYGYDFLSPDFEDTSIPIEDWGPGSDITAKMILSGEGQVKKAWVMVDANNDTYLARMELMKNTVYFQIHPWDPEKE
jgi:hypothetical protein